jgi:hypothetical protein
MSYSEIRSKEALDKALSLCKGCYQRDLVLGREALSGATLRGKAYLYVMRYKESGRSLVQRLTSAGVGREEIQGHGKRVLVIG